VRVAHSDFRQGLAARSELLHPLLPWGRPNRPTCSERAAGRSVLLADLAVAAVAVPMTVRPVPSPLRPTPAPAEGLATLRSPLPLPLLLLLLRAVRSLTIRAQVSDLPPLTHHLFCLPSCGVALQRVDLLSCSLWICRCCMPALFAILCCCWVLFARCEQNCRWVASAPNGSPTPLRPSPSFHEQATYPRDPRSGTANAHPPHPPPPHRRRGTRRIDGVMKIADGVAAVAAAVAVVVVRPCDRPSSGRRPRSGWAPSQRQL
jgi:hypothetical protein